METIILGGGCYWCFEALFSRLNGVSDVVSGFCGGTLANPTYEDVVGDATGHIEVVRVVFDPRVISLEVLYTIYFDFHDPTSWDRQGDEVGHLYHSVIFAQTPGQKALAEAMIERMNNEGRYLSPIVTEVADAQPFWPAGSDHQRYYDNHPIEDYCIAIIVPALVRLRKNYAAYLKPTSFSAEGAYAI
ncbi:peptide-methionine (S)-S-oxide reductase [Chromobacterium amazonense]|uniref:peptide-methionine (S)-S-oxide reductase MsrA n=1 Tax=Chromobacterium amazonense TaxID=1382803 RepID=UPI0008D9D845|nr:peptide-methionine (S)-S-oxide reductase MsrA [Chromobacterium amazonense]OHX15397.1 peptide-methionine (S)-S-oxide reductase [Chromobacterium amazonense]